MDAAQGRRPCRAMRREALQVSQPRELVDEAGEQEEADHALPDEQFGCLRPCGSLDKPGHANAAFDREGKDRDQRAGDRDVTDAHLVPESGSPFPVERGRMVPFGQKPSIHVEPRQLVTHATPV